MTVDRYTKVVLTVIAVCLVWLSVGGPSLVTPVRAQDDARVLLRGWLDDTGRVISFPAPAPLSDPLNSGRVAITPARPRSTAPLPIVAQP